MKIRDIVFQPVYASAFLKPVQLPTQNPTCTFPLWSVITVTFNMAATKKIVVPADLHVDRTFNGARRAALGAIEGEIPTTTAVVTGINPEVTSKVNMEGSVCEVLHKFTVLQK